MSLLAPEIVRNIAYVTFISCGIKHKVNLILTFKCRPKYCYPQGQAPNIIYLTSASLSTTFSPEKTKGIKHPTKQNRPWQKSKRALENELKPKGIGSLIVWYTSGERTWITQYNCTILNFSMRCTIYLFKVLPCFPRVSRNQTDCLTFGEWIGST